MRFVLFYHSLISDWNHGNAHFLRGVVTDLLRRGHAVQVWEPRNAWSVQNLLADHGHAPLVDIHRHYPGLYTNIYEPAKLDLDAVLREADVVLVHEWNDPELVKAVGEHRANGGQYQLLFHDTHHRAVSAPHEIGQFDLTHYDGVLAFGQIISDLYIKNGWARRCFTWHEAADTSVFYPHQEPAQKDGDLVWVGNWGDEERTAELHEFLIEPVKSLNLKAKIYGVRYPEHALKALAGAGIEYGGYLPNYLAPQVFARYRFTVHVPRRPYAQRLSGIPTIRPFEAMACGIPLISAPWTDSEHLFTPGSDYLVAKDGAEMKHHIRRLLSNKPMAQAMSQQALATINDRHTCAHRVDQLLGYLAELGAGHVDDLVQVAPRTLSALQFPLAEGAMNTEAAN